MQHRSILGLAFALCVVPLVSSASLNAAAKAKYFLQRHTADAPNADELAELKNQNPEAYALVNALLTKRSLGLLDPKHPTASFTKVDEKSTSEDQGPEAFAKFASPGELAAHSQQAASAAPVDVPYAAVQSAPAHRDWLNWKPQSSADNDEAMVQNVLGAVAELKGGKKAGLLAKRESNENTLLADAATLTDDSSRLSGQAPPVHAAPAHENSYLKGLGMDLSGDMPKAVSTSDDTPKKISQAQSSSSNYLTAFSWDDSKPQEQPRAKVEQPELKVDPKEANLLSWLGVVKKAPPTQSTPPAKAAQPSNPYIMDLSS
jgi:hypothetical protein